MSDGCNLNGSLLDGKRTPLCNISNFGQRNSFKHFTSEDLTGNYWHMNNWQLEIILWSICRLFSCKCIITLLSFPVNSVKLQSKLASSSTKCKKVLNNLDPDIRRDLLNDFGSSSESTVGDDYERIGNERSFIGSFSMW